jgi:hypothetical protein
MRMIFNAFGIAATVVAMTALIPQQAGAQRVCQQECVGPVCQERCVETSDRDRIRAERREERRDEERREDRREERREERRDQSPGIELRVPGVGIEVGPR